MNLTSNVFCRYVLSLCYALPSAAGFYTLMFYLLHACVLISAYASTYFQIETPDYKLKMRIVYVLSCSHDLLILLDFVYIRS